MRTILTIIGFLSFFACATAQNDTEHRKQKQFSLFSVVSFQNDECNSTTTTGTSGTCYTSSECSGRGGTANGNCAAGFGVCCVVSTTTCGSTISTNTTYIRNPGYPSTYTPTSAGTCTYKIEKVSADICQLRLDFQTMSGHLTLNTGACSDTFAAAGQTGKNPPSICGTNTGYHMYVEFGTAATDSITLTNTWLAAGLTTPKQYNILARQIPCSAKYRAPRDCVQYFTGVTGNVQSYNFQGNTMLHSQTYNNCIRTEKGYCKIQWKESSSTAPDPFQVGAGTTIDGTACTEFINIPNLSPDGVLPIPVPAGEVQYQNENCGSGFGIPNTVSAPTAVPITLTSAQQPFLLGVYTATTDTSARTSTGFNLDYTQMPC